METQRLATEDQAVAPTEARAAAAVWPVMLGTVAATASLSWRLPKSSGAHRRGVSAAENPWYLWDGVPPWLFFLKVLATPHPHPQSVPWRHPFSCHLQGALISQLCWHPTGNSLKEILRKRLVKGPLTRRRVDVVSKRKALPSLRIPSTWCNLIFLYRMNQEAKWKRRVKKSNCHQPSIDQIVTPAVCCCTLANRDQWCPERERPLQPPSRRGISRLLTHLHAARVNRTQPENCIVVRLLVCSPHQNPWTKIQRSVLWTVTWTCQRKSIFSVPYKGVFPWRFPTLTLEFYVTFQIQNSVALALLMCTFICLLAIQLSCLTLLLMQTQVTKGMLLQTAQV